MAIPSFSQPAPSPLNQAPIDPIVTADAQRTGATRRSSSVEAPAVEASEAKPGLDPNANRDGDAVLLSQAAQSERAADGTELTDEERREVDKLRDRDRRVRAHEQAHVAAAGSLYRGGPTYEFETGPDGKQYAVGGSVRIDTSKAGGDPEATVRKAQQIRRAALAPQDPSPTDRAVAAKAQAMEAEARREMVEASLEDQKSASDRDVAEPVSADRAGDAGGPTASRSEVAQVARAGDLQPATRPGYAFSELEGEPAARAANETLNSKPSESMG